MMKMILKMQDLPFQALTGVYAESLQDAASRDHTGRDDGLLQAEMDLYAYLKDHFFRTPGSRYCLWEENGKVLCALRLEPYQDGLLLTALETAPEHRRKGFAEQLMCAVAEWAEEPVYSHIYRRNLASIALHEKCGFEKITNFAVFLDGSVSRQADTYCLKFVKN